MRARRLAAVAALVLGVLGAPAPALAGQADGGPVLVPSTGETVTTPLTTTAGHLYRVTVTGVYSYNGSVNFADCGWWNPEGEGDAWYRGGFFLVDGVPANCVHQPYTTTHTYTWEQQGTGAPLSFRIVDGGYADNIGGLLVDVVAVAGRYDVAGYCEVGKLDNGGSGGMPDVFTVAVHARATGGAGPPPMLYAMCYMFGPGGWAMVSSGPGTPATAGADVVVRPHGSYTICLLVDAYDWSEWRFLSLGCRAI